ncbi:MAG TPA: phage tail protein [Pyrinomonadaceae bacterium]|nr:phage tail protein [Pyrinomonadaceae bacterium]
MKPVEFRSQIFRDSAQWQYGLGYRLDQRDNGVALFSRPAFVEWATQSEEARGASSLAVDECGLLFWINPQNCRLYRYDRTSGLIEVMTQLAQCDEEHKHNFGRILIVEHRLWILDRDGSRVIALRPDTFQIITEIPVSNPIDIAWSAGRLLVLDHNGISAYDVNGKPLQLQQRCTPATIALGADPKGQWIYVVDSVAKGFLRFKADGSFADEIGVFSEVEAGFRPRLLALNPGGSLFACDESKLAHQFSADGGYIGDTGDLVPLSGISAITFGPSGDLYAAAPEGIARYGSATGLAGNEGVFYTRTLDSGCDDVDCWHRLDLTADLESGGALDVQYATASNEDAGLVNAINNVFVRESPLQEKVATLEGLLTDRWQTPDELRATADNVPQASLRERPTHSMLFRAQTSRYLWLRLTLSGLAAGSRASVSSMRVYYPRLTYLRYLPAVYQENEVSKEFLGRYLSLFETLFSGLEATIETIPDVFDPERTPKEFLDWLAQWLDLGIEEDWKPEVKRQLIRKASSLYQKKGTPAALTEFIEIVTGRRPLIRESFQVERPFILGEGRSLGNETYVFPQPVKPLPREQRTVLGSSSLGRTLISESATVPIDPFRAAAHHFTVLLDLSPQEFQRHERGLHRIIRENSPAHVGYDLRLVSDVGLGPNLMLGINFRVQDPQPLHLGHSSLGRSVLSRFRYGPELGIDTLVTGSSCGSNDAALFYGEQ